MRRVAQQLGRKNLLVAILLVCVLCATVVANSHVHSPSDRTSESHCSLCMLAATLAAVAVSIALTLTWKLWTRFEPSEPRLLRELRVICHSIRPPPQTALCC